MFVAIVSTLSNLEKHIGVNGASTLYSPSSNWYLYENLTNLFSKKLDVITLPCSSESDTPIIVAAVNGAYFATEIISSTLLFKLYLPGVFLAVSTFIFLGGFLSSVKNKSSSTKFMPVIK